MEREMATSFYSEEELQQMGFAHVGHDVMISRKASIYGASNIWIGNHVRVDDFCVLSGKITFGNYIHVAVTTTLFGGTAGITFEDYTGISSHCAVYAASDDYSGDFMTNPTVPEKFTNVIEEPVVIKKYSNIGAGCIILPGVTIAEGCALCAMTLATSRSEARRCWNWIYRNWKPTRLPPVPVIRFGDDTGKQRACRRKHMRERAGL